MYNMYRQDYNTSHQTLSVSPSHWYFWLTILTSHVKHLTHMQSANHILFLFCLFAYCLGKVQRGKSKGSRNRVLHFIFSVSMVCILLVHFETFCQGWKWMTEWTSSCFCQRKCLKPTQPLSLSVLYNMYTTGTLPSPTLNHAERTLGLNWHTVLRMSKPEAEVTLVTKTIGTDWQIISGLSPTQKW